jgi:hypothetical protein
MHHLLSININIIRKKEETIEFLLTECSERLNECGKLELHLE